MSTPVKIVLGAAAGLLLLLAGFGVWVYQKGYVDAMKGGMAQGEGRLDEAIGHFERAYRRNPNAYMVAHDLACCYSVKNDKKNCFLWLRKALETDHADAVRSSARIDQDFANVREDAEFKSLIAPRPGRP